MSNLIDPQLLVGERVFIETHKGDFIGTLTETKEYSFKLTEWFPVLKYDNEKVLARGEKGQYSKIIMHAGGSRECKTIKISTLKGDPFVDGDLPKEESDETSHEHDEELPAWLADATKIETPRKTGL